MKMSKFGEAQIAAGETSFIDKVSVDSVSEPASWGLMIVGFGLVGAMTRRRKRSVIHA